jgi:hypothetical protein
MPDQNIPGAVCAPDEACVETFDAGIASCMQTCQPFGESCPSREVLDGSVPIDQGCYFFPASRVSVCASPTGDAGPGDSCQLATDCAIPNTCGVAALDGGGLSSDLVCPSSCDVFPDGSPTSTPPPDGGSQACSQGSVCAPLPSGIVAGTCERFPREA